MLKKRTVILIVIYFVFLTFCILFKGSYTYLQACISAYQSGIVSQERVNLHFFQTIGASLYQWKNSWLLMNLLINIVLFVPWGIFLGKKLEKWDGYRWTVVGILGMILSLCYELIQHFAGIGCFDVDDIVLNCVGTLLGYGLFVVYHNYDQIRLPFWLQYVLMQTAVNLVYFLCCTSCYYIFHINYGMSKATGVFLVIGIGGMWYHWNFERRSKSTIKTIDKTSETSIYNSIPKNIIIQSVDLLNEKKMYLLLVGKCLQILCMEWIIVNWIPYGWGGLVLTILLWIVVLWIWYRLDWKINILTKTN